jgi:hypothetical protein
MFDERMIFSEIRYRRVAVRRGQGESHFDHTVCRTILPRLCGRAPGDPAALLKFKPWPKIYLRPLIAALADWRPAAGIPRCAARRPDD